MAKMKYSVLHLVRSGQHLYQVGRGTLTGKWKPDRTFDDPLYAFAQADALNDIPSAPLIEMPDPQPVIQKPVTPAHHSKVVRPRRNRI